MDALRLLVIFIFLTVGTNADETTNREERCGASQKVYTNKYRQRHNIKKFIARTDHAGHKFRSKSTPSPVPVSFQYDQLPVDGYDFSSGTASASSWDTAMNNNPSRGTHQEEIGDGNNDELESGSSPRITISENGDVTLGRSLNFHKVKTFHDERHFGHDHGHDHIMEEDHHHSHKSFRTSRNERDRSALPPAIPSKLGMQQWQSNPNVFQGLSAAGGAETWNIGGVEAVGGNIVFAQSGVSEAQYEGDSDVVAYIVDKSVKSGAKAPAQRDVETFQGINAGNTVQTGNYLQALASGLAVNLTSSGSSSGSGTGSISTAGTTTITESDGSTSGWRAPNEAKNFGASNGAESSDNLSATLSGLQTSLEGSGSTSVTGSGSMNIYGTTSVSSSHGESGWKAQ